MEKALLILLIIAGNLFNSNAQAVKESKVPLKVKTAFQKQYAGVAAKWEKENQLYEVNFKKVIKQCRPLLISQV